MFRRKKIRTYQFFNFKTETHGMAWGMCDKHREQYVGPDYCKLIELAPTSNLGCTFCDRGNGPINYKEEQK